MAAPSVEWWQYIKHPGTILHFPHFKYQFSEHTWRVVSLLALNAGPMFAQLGSSQHLPLIFCTNHNTLPPPWHHNTSTNLAQTINNNIPLLLCVNLNMKIEKAFIPRRNTLKAVSGSWIWRWDVPVCWWNWDFPSCRGIKEMMTN